MTRRQLRPIAPDDADAAGRLLADRHRRQRVDVPLLDPSYESPSAAAAVVAELLSIEGASGALAIEGGRPVGFVVGTPRSAGDWGPNIWVEAGGSAADDPEVIRDLYGCAAQRWVDEGRSAHYALVPATDVEQLTAWYRSGFGQQHVHALRPSATPLSIAPVAEVTLRPAVRADLDALVELDLLVPHQVRQSPVFSSIVVPTAAEVRAEWEEGFDEAGQLLLVAELAGSLVGVAVLVPVELSSNHVGLARPVGAAIVGLVSVFPVARGRGVGRLLGASVVEWATAAGYTCVVTDWRAANLSSSRIWPGLGFQDTFLRLHRNVGY